MNKFCLLTLTAITALQLNSFAQDAEDTRDNLVFGVKAGVNLSNVYDSKGENFVAKPKAGFAAGAFLSIPIGKYVGLQPEVLYSQKGFKASGRAGLSTYELKRTTSYLDIPIFLAIKPVEVLTILVGPQYSYLLSQSDAVTYGSTSVANVIDFDNDNVRKNTLSFAGGLDINLRHIVLGARAGWDLMNNNGNGTSNTPRYKNVWYQATIGFRIY